MIFFAIGVADFAFILVFLAWTGIVTHNMTRATEQEKASQQPRK